MSNYKTNKNVNNLQDRTSIDITGGFMLRFKDNTNKNPQMSNTFFNKPLTAKIITGALVIFLFIILDILNLESYTNEMSRDVSTRFSSYFYPREPDDIVVINTNEDSARYWPPTYRDYAGWLEYIADYHPKAIFFDINFIVRKDSTFKDEFIEAINYAKNIKNTESENIKIYGIRNYDSDPEISSLITPVAIEWEMEDGFYPAKDSEGKTMAAFQIYQDLYNSDEFFTPMFIKWPSRPSSEPSSIFAKFFKGLCLAIAICDSSYDDKPYLDKYNTNNMFLTNEEAKKKFGGRIVFFGNERVADKDFFQNPIYGQIPGVFVHAMALDNLIKYDNKYFKHSDSKTLFFNLDSGDLIEIFILAFNLFLYLKFDESTQDAKNKKTAKKSMYISFFLILLCSIVILVGIYISHILLRNDPSNVIGLLATNLFFYVFTYSLILLLLIKIFKSKTEIGSKPKTKIKSTGDNI